MMVIMRTSDLPQPLFPSIHLKRQILNEIDEDANEQHKVLQIQFLAANNKSQLCETSDDQQTDLDISNSEIVIVKFNVQQINPGGNNCIFICRNCENDNGNSNENENDTKLPKVFIAKEFGDDKDELDTYEHLASLQSVYIPKCFGEIRWKDEAGIMHQGIALEFLKGFRRLEDTDAKNELIYWKYKKAFEVIGNKGIFHGDIAFRNLMWHPESEDIRVIDFENAKMDTEMLVRDGISVQQQNFIDLESLFNVEDSDMIQERLPTICTIPLAMLNPPVLPPKILEQLAGSEREVNG